MRNPYSRFDNLRLTNHRPVLGASGLLGSAVYEAFKKSLAQHTVLGLAHSRSTDELKKLDLLDYEATERVFSEFKPDCELLDECVEIPYILTTTL